MTERLDGDAGALGKVLEAVAEVVLVVDREGIIQYIKNVSRVLSEADGERERREWRKRTRGIGGSKVKVGFASETALERSDRSGYAPLNSEADGVVGLGV